MTDDRLPPRPRGALADLVTKAFGPGVDPRDVSVVELPGGASTRRYFRVRVGAGPAGGGAVRGAIAMYAPDGAKPEEITAGGASARWPFV
ncbi:MAG: hypothetical protein ABI175_21600, partial [Polyangiales bacterium]